MTADRHKERPEPPLTYSKVIIITHTHTHTHTPLLCFIVLKTQIKIRPQPLVNDVSVVCVWFGSSVLRLCAIYTQHLRLHRLFANRQAPTLKQRSQNTFFFKLILKLRRLRKFKALTTSQSYNSVKCDDTDVIQIFLDSAWLWLSWGTPTSHDDSSERTDRGRGRRQNVLRG